MAEPRTHPSGATYAGWWERVVAEIVDALLLAPVFIVTNLFFDVVVVTFVTLVAGILYNGRLDGDERGQTVGKRVMKVRVIDDETGDSIGIARGYQRAAVVEALRVLNLLSPLAFVLGLLDVLWPLWDAKRQTWHDKAVRSVVVKVT